EKDRILSALDQLDECHLGPIALTMTDLQHTGVATRPFREARTDRIEECEEHIIVLDLPGRKSTRVEIPSLRQRDEPLGERAQVLRLGRVRMDSAMADQARCHVPKKRFAMTRGAAELPPFLSMSHFS